MSSATAQGEQALEKFLANRRKVSRAELTQLLDLAREHGGELVDMTALGAADPDDWCGTMWFHRPRPKVGELVDTLVAKGWTVEIFPRGIINPDALQIIVRNQAGGR